MTGGISMLGSQASVVNLPDGTNGYAPAFKDMNVSLGGYHHRESGIAPSRSSDLEAFSH
jgi:hypothetical protein